MVEKTLHPTIARRAHTLTLPFTTRRGRFALLGLLVIGSLFTTYFFSSGKARAANDPVYSGDTSKPRIAITFDDGPSPETPKVLDTLAQYQVKATFFEIGSNVYAYPDYARRVVAEGHVLANHTYDHVSLPDLSDSDALAQISSTTAAIQNVTGTTPSLLRPPFGAFDQRILNLIASQGLTTIMWNLDASDWSDPGVDYITSTIVNGTQNGSIILLHDGYGRSQTSAALPSILQQLKARGFQFVTVPELLNPSNGNGNGGNPTTTTLRPSEDRDNYASNSGNDPSLHGSIYQTSYLKFPLSSLSGTVSSAKLRLYRPYANDAVTITAYGVNNDSWSEWNNSLPAVGAALNSANSPGAGYVEIDVTSFVAAQKNGDGMATLAFNASSTYWTTFNSKDNSSNQPELVVQTS